MQKIKVVTSSRPEISSVGNEFETVVGDWLTANPKIEVLNMSVSNDGHGAWIVVIFYK